MRLLPLPNTLRHIVRPPRPVSEIKESILAFLERINLLTPPQDQDQHANKSDSECGMICLVASSNTWSRAARRKQAQAQAQAQAQSDTQIPVNQTPEPVTTILLKADITIRTDSVQIDWTHGRDRADFDSLWKSIVANSGLVTHASGGKTGSGSGSGTGSRSGVGVRDSWLDSVLQVSNEETNPISKRKREDGDGDGDDASNTDKERRVEAG